MNPPLAFDDALVQLKLFTSQTANFTFTDDEINQALETAWNDSFVCDEVWDSSLTYQLDTWQYPIPFSLSRVLGIYIKRSSDADPEPIAASLYEIVAGNIQFSPNATRWLADTYTLYIKGLYKLTTDDELDTANLVNYVIRVAAFILLSQLALKAAFVFLRNDISMTDIIRAKQDIQTDMLRYRQTLRREFEKV